MPPRLPALPFASFVNGVGCALFVGAELYGKVLRVNAAKPMKHKLGAHTAGNIFFIPRHSVSNNHVHEVGTGAFCSAVVRL